MHSSAADSRSTIAYNAAMARKPAPAPPPDTGAILLGQVLDAPDDTAAKLVYADWLEERGHPLADLLRAHCEGREPGANASAAASERIGLLGQWIHGPHFDSGMIARIDVAGGKYAQKATQAMLLPILSVFGVRRTRLHGTGIRVPSCASLAWTTELWWWDCQADDQLVAALAESPHVTRLSTLFLEKTRCTNAGLAAIARSPQLARLRHLGLKSPVHGGSFDAHGLVDLLAQRSLDGLDLSGGWNKIKLAILDAPPLAQLKQLAISVDRIGPLAECQHVTGLESLLVASYGTRHSDDLGALLDNPAFAKLQRLDLRMDALEPRLVERLQQRFGDRFTHASYGY